MWYCTSQCTCKSGKVSALFDAKIRIDYWYILFPVSKCSPRMVHRVDRWWPNCQCHWYYDQWCAGGEWWYLHFKLTNALETHATNSRAKRIRFTTAYVSDFRIIIFFTLSKDYKLIIDHWPHTTSELGLYHLPEPVRWNPKATVGSSLTPCTDTYVVTYWPSLANENRTQICKLPAQ